MKILHTADWHIGPFQGPSQDGVNLRENDTYRCLDELANTAKNEMPDLCLISGDIFHVAAVGQARGHAEVLKARKIINDLAECSGFVIVMRGTPNHDDAGAFAELSAHFESVSNVAVVTEPEIINCMGVDVAVVPGFDRGIFRAKFPGLSKEEENQVFTTEIAKIVIGLKAKCDPTHKTVLMAHITVPGCNMEAGQNTFLQSFEPVLTTETLNTAGYDLVCLGHVHRPQQLPNCSRVFYSGSINALNFNDEGQDKGFWIHELDDDGEIDSRFIKTPSRQFYTMRIGDEDVTQINAGHTSEIIQKHADQVRNRIVRVLYSCTDEHEKALDKASLQRELEKSGAFYVWDIAPESITATADKTDMGKLDPEDNLRIYLESHGIEKDDADRLIHKARPIITKATAAVSKTTPQGVFEPVSIEVKNYRNYKEEHFDFDKVKFCTINGVNGAGKSSLFLDAILDALWEEPREGDLTGWIRNDEDVKSGYIAFTGKIGEKTYRVVRTRTKSGKATLNLAELVDGSWENRSREKMRDTQEAINEVLGMDSMTLKSCALIMQDQYGLFLQAPKDQRMAILGNLLGLGVYGEMERIAAENGKTFGAKLRDIKSEMEINENSISAYGTPDAAKDQLQAIVSQLESEKATAQQTEDALTFQIQTLSEAKARAEKLHTEISSITAKADGLNQQIFSMQRDISAYDEELKESDHIHEAAKEYKQLEEQSSSLKTQAEMYDNKMRDYEHAKESIAKREAEIHDSIELRLNSINQQLKEINVDPDLISEAQKNAKAYEDASQAVMMWSSRKAEYLSASNEKARETAKLDQIEANYDRARERVNTEKEALERRTTLLQDSGCIDPDRAHCKFLADAQKARQELGEIPDRLKQIDEEYAPQIDKQKQIVESCNVTLETMNADEIDSKLKKAQEDRDRLQRYPAELERLRNLETKEASLLEQKNLVWSTYLMSTRHVEETKENAAKIFREASQYKQAKIQKDSIDDRMRLIKSTAEKEKQIPVIEEKRASAIKMVDVLRSQYQDAIDQYLEKDKEHKRELEKVEGLEDIKAKWIEASGKVDEITQKISSIQIEIGSLNEKIRQIEAINERNRELLKQKTTVAQEVSDYDFLKQSFSQDGIPHQIVRSVIPQLTSKANAILGQMTGGRMGIQFQTERTLKSNKNKEVETLDILIAEYGKTTLPYLSKSGGEKVKASLSVILALAETKSSTAGMQFGMLFIDEPPFLDVEGVQAYCDALVTIQGRYPGLKIMAVTHDPSMKARFPQSITVTKDDEGSHVSWD